ncbi:MAG: spheroidene monooxygenase [Gammaproteobacteria bacterium]|nr:spheroidene monooxygenase [Gammaproteobacteria bacterium]
MSTVAVVVLIDAESSARGWAARRLALGRYVLRGTPGLTFLKVLGSGRDGGFRLKPSATHGGLMCAFEDAGSAERFVRDSPVMTDYRRHARELLTVRLQAYASRGRWSGVNAFPAVTEPDPSQPVAALTRASIHPLKAWKFWRHAAPSEDALHAAPGCLLAAGLGEAPFLRQATFTIWENEATMDAYARDGAHLAAIQAARGGRYFTEDMFVRFVPFAVEGSWHGRDYVGTCLDTVPETRSSERQWPQAASS